MEKIKRFFREVFAEAKKTKWPTRKELVISTSVVLVILLAMGAYFFVLDLLLSGAVRALLTVLGIR